MVIFLSSITTDASGSKGNFGHGRTRQGELSRSRLYDAVLGAISPNMEHGFQLPSTLWSPFEGVRVCFLQPENQSLVAEAP